MYEQFIFIDNYNLIDYEYLTYRSIIKLKLQVYFKSNSIPKQYTVDMFYTFFFNDGDHE